MGTGTSALGEGVNRGQGRGALMAGQQCPSSCPVCWCEGLGQ